MLVDKPEVDLLFAIVLIELCIARSYERNYVEVGDFLNGGGSFGPKMPACTVVGVRKRYPSCIIKISAVGSFILSQNRCA